jgi:transaldolase
MNGLKELERLGQSVWLDGWKRQHLTSGKLKELIDQYGVSGIIANLASIQSELPEGAYDRSMARIIEGSPEIDTDTLLEKLWIEDVERASDLVRPIYERSRGRDGLISLDLNPHLAYDTGQSVHEARQLWARIRRENVLIKIPATAEGIAAIEPLTAEGIPVNATLIFTVSQYEAVAEAYLRGRKRTECQVNSAASFPVSELDRAVDRALEEVATEEALSLKKKAGIAAAALVYRGFRQIFHDRRFPNFAGERSGAVRPVWVTTTVEGEARSEVRYIQTLIGRESASAISIQALAAFGQHGHAEEGLDTAGSRAGETVGALLKLGINLKSVGQELTDRGVEELHKSYDELVRALAEKRSGLGSQPAA